MNDYQAIYDKQAEQNTLGAAMLSMTSYNEIKTIVDVYGSEFYEMNHQEIWKAITAVAATGVVPDPTLVRVQMMKSGTLKHADGGIYLTTLIHTVPSHASGGYYADIVAKHHKMRAIAEVATRLGQMVQETKLDDVDDIAKVAMKEVAFMGERFAATRKTKITTMSDTMKRTRWMWDNRIPMNSLSLLAGLRDIGKTSLLCKIASDATNGNLDGEYAGKPVKVLYIFTEDSEEMTITPRLVAAGADMSRVVKWNGTFMLSRDLDELRDNLAAHPDIKLIIIDPLSGVLTANQRGNGGAEMREALQHASQMADDLDVAILGNAHFKKAGDADVLNRVTGSAELVNVVRTVMAASVYDSDDYDEKTCVLSVEKNNLGLSSSLEGDLYQFRMVQNVGRDADDGSQVDAVKVVFVGKTSVTVSTISESQASGGSASMTSECEQGLFNLVRSSPDPVLRADAVKWRKANDYSEHAFKTAVSSLKKQGKLFRVTTGNGAEVAFSTVPDVKPKAVEAPVATPQPPVDVPAPQPVPVPVSVPLTPVVEPVDTNCQKCRWPESSQGHYTACVEPVDRMFSMST